MTQFTPTSAGLAGGAHLLTADLAPSICPECPWRYKMVEGFSTAKPFDDSMMQAALTRKLPLASKEHDMAQGCHMRLDLRCRGAEHFRANIGLPSEVTTSGTIVASEAEALEVWSKR